MTAPYRDAPSEARSCTYGPFRPLLTPIALGLVVVALGGVVLWAGMSVGQWVLPVFTLGGFWTIGALLFRSGLANWQSFRLRSHGRWLTVERRSRWGGSEACVFDIVDPQRVRVEWFTEARLGVFGVMPPRAGCLVVEQRDGRCVRLTNEELVGAQRHLDGMRELEGLLRLRRLDDSER